MCLAIVHGLPRVSTCARGGLSFLIAPVCLPCRSNGEYKKVARRLLVKERDTLNTILDEVGSIALGGSLDSDHTSYNTPIIT